MVKQSPNRTGNRIWHFFGHTVGVKAHALFHHFTARIFIVFRLTLHNNPPRNTHNGCTSRYGLGYHRIRTDLSASTDFERPKNLRARTDHYTITDCGVPLTLIPAGTTERNTLIKRDIITNHRSFTDHNTHTVVDKEATTNGCSRVNFNAGKPTGQGRDRARQPLQPQTPNPVRKAMQQKRVQPRIVS